MREYEKRWVEHVAAHLSPHTPDNQREKGETYSHAINIPHTVQSKIQGFFWGGGGGGGMVGSIMTQSILWRACPRGFFGEHVLEGFKDMPAPGKF